MMIGPLLLIAAANSAQLPVSERPSASTFVPVAGASVRARASVRILTAAKFGEGRSEEAPGARQRVSFRVTKQDLAYYDEAAKRFVTAPGEYEMAAGRSSADLPVSARVRVP